MLRPCEDDRKPLPFRRSHPRRQRTQAVVAAVKEAHGASGWTRRLAAERH